MECLSLEGQVRQNIKFFGNFGDISPLLDNPELRQKIIAHFSYWLKINHTEMKIDRIAGIETRGAIWGALLAQYLNRPFSIVRRGGKLHEGLQPIRQEFVNYKGKLDSLEVSPHHFHREERVVIVDDWFETGQSAMAAKELIERCGANVVAFCTIVNDTSEHPDAQKFFSQHPFCSIVNLKK